MRIRLDEVDQKILRILQDDGRVTNADLARMIGLSPPSALQRVRKLEELRLIKGYVGLLNAERLGFGLTVFAQVSLALHQDKAIERFKREVAEIPQVVEAYNVSGEFDYLLKIVVEDMRAYENLIRERLSTIKGLSKIQSCFVLASAKQTTKLPL